MVNYSALDIKVHADKKEVDKMFKSKKFKRFLIVSIIFFSVFSVTFSIGIFNNPNFNILDFCTNLASELLGLVIALVIVDSYISTKREYRQEKSEQPVDQAADVTKINNGFEVINNNDPGTVKSISTVRDKQTGVQYLLVIHEYGSGLTPLLDNEGKPIIDEQTKDQE